MELYENIDMVETIIHEGPTDTRKLENDIQAVSGVKSQAEAKKGEVCPRCKSGYINPVGDSNKLTQKMSCHNCGYTYDKLDGASIVSFLIVMGLIIWVCSGGLGTCSP